MPRFYTLAAFVFSSMFITIVYMIVRSKDSNEQFAKTLKYCIIRIRIICKS